MKNAPPSVPPIAPPKGPRCFHAVIEFVDAQGHPHRFTPPGGDTEPKPRRGTRLSVRYRHGNPDDAFISTFAQMWVMPIAWLAAGVVALFLARQG